ncbi:MAG: AbrB/MazE/SpoVT family DNA-binding domain-containing protein [Bacteroidota bacterium]
MDSVVTVNKWGRSLGIRIPKSVANELHITEGQQLTVELQDSGVMLSSLLTSDWLVEGMTKENRHELVFGDNLVGREIWE